MLIGYGFLIGLMLAGLLAGIMINQTNLDLLSAARVPAQLEPNVCDNFVCEPGFSCVVESGAPTCRIIDLETSNISDAYVYLTLQAETFVACEEGYDHVTSQDCAELDYSDLDSINRDIDRLFSRAESEAGLLVSEYERLQSDYDFYDQFCAQEPQECVTEDLAEMSESLEVFAEYATTCGTFDLVCNLFTESSDIQS